MPFTVTQRNTWLDSLPSPMDLSLHTGDPGVNGTANELSGGSPAYARKAGTFAAASGGSRSLSAAVDFDGPASTGVTHFGAWDGATFKGSGTVSGDASTNAEGKYRLTTGTSLTIT